jgi:hypothetical protein
MTASRSILLGALLAVAAACTTHRDLEETLMSFQVTLVAEEAQIGSEAAPLPFEAGRMCEADDECVEGRACVRFCELAGNACESDRECPGNYEACTGACTISRTVNIEAIGSSGARVPFTGYLEVEVVPGFVPPPARSVFMKNGVAEGVEVRFARAVGETNVWVEDTGYLPRTAEYGECNDGLDNDGNGSIDLADPGCDGETDAIEHAVSGAAGVSRPAMIFEQPRMRHVQYTNAVAKSSPLQGHDVRFDTGTMVVTNVSANGFFVTDIDYQARQLQNGEPGYFNSLFLFTFSTPQNVNYGDVLCWLSGGVVEFMGNTQLTFVSYWTWFGGDNLLDLEECGGNRSLDLELLKGLDTETLVPEPVDVTDELIVEDLQSAKLDELIAQNSVTLEPYENGLIKIRNLDLSRRFLACDVNGNDEIDWGGDEFECRNVCQEDPYCTQFESYFKYDQYAVYVDGRKKMYLSGETQLEFKPIEIEYLGQEDKKGQCTPSKVWIGDTRFVQYDCPPRSLVSAVGNLRHVYLCGTTWDESRCGLQLHTVIPRFDSDIIEADEPVTEEEAP